MKDPLLGPLAAIAAGIFAARYAVFTPTELLVGIGALLVLGIFALLRQSKVVAGFACLTGFALAGALTAVAHTPGPPPQLDAEAREVVILGGCVVEPPAVSGERERFTLELEPGARAEVTLYERKGETLPTLRYGQKIEMDARVRKPHNFGNPGAFDFAHYLSRQGVFWTASGAAGTVKILPGQCGSRLAKVVMDLRAGALDRIARMYPDDAYRRAMVQAILVGQNYQLQRMWTEDYRDTGTFHTLVISGTHVAILAAFFLFLLKVCFIPETPALFLTVAAMWLYAGVAGFGAPCVRSAAGLTLFAIARYLYRERRPLNLLAMVALCFLLFDPDQLFDSSFQLTFLAVAFLGAFATPLIEATSGPLARGLSELADVHRDMHALPRVAQFRIEMRLLTDTLYLALRVPRRVGRWLVTIPARGAFFFYEVGAVSAIAQIGLAVPMVVYFHRMGLSGLSANAFIIPILGLAMPVGFLAVFTNWAWLGHLTGWLLSISRVIVAWHASVEPAWRIPPPPAWLAVAFCGGLVLAAMARGKWLRVAAYSLQATLFTLIVWHPFPPETHRGELELTAIDVGQGDSLLVVFPDGKRMLVDGGGIPAFGGAARKMDLGEDVVAPYLWERGIRSVDVVALTHAHEDHIGGLPALTADFHPKQILDRCHARQRHVGKGPGESARRGREDPAARWSADVRLRRRADRHPAPLPDYIAGDTPKNDDSLVMRIRYGARSFLLTGDVEKPIEYRMLAENELSHADVLKVAHHGSHTSSTAAFLDAVSPEFAIISDGLENSYGHPNRDVLDRLEERRTAVYRTDLAGLITIRTDGWRIAVETPASLSAWF